MKWYGLKTNEINGIEGKQVRTYWYEKHNENKWKQMKWNDSKNPRKKGEPEGKSSM